MATSRPGDILITIHHHSSTLGSVPIAVLVRQLGLSNGAVTGLLKQLATEGLVDYEPYRGARLSSTGTLAARRLLRRTRLFERFLTDVLGYGWDEAPEEAHRLSQAASDSLVDRLAAYLGDPHLDPHGAPIPDATGCLDEDRIPRLCEMDAGQKGVLRRVTEEEPELLRYLAHLDLVPGSRIEVLGRVPFDSAMRIRIGGREQVLAASVSASLRVERITE